LFLALFGFVFVTRRRHKCSYLLVIKELKANFGLSWIGFVLGLNWVCFLLRQAGKISYLLALKGLMAILMVLELGLFSQKVE